MLARLGKGIISSALVEGRSPTSPDRLGCCVVARSFASRIRPETIARGLGKGGLNVKGKLKERGGVGRTALEAGVPKMNTDGVGGTVCAPDGVGGTVCSPILMEEKYCVARGRVQ